MSDAERRNDFSGIEAPRFSRCLDRCVELCGSVVAWAAVLLVLVILSTVLLRYVAQVPTTAWDELQWRLYAALIMVGLSYAQIHEAHVRIDILRRRWTARTRALVEVVGIVVLQLPFVCLLCWSGAGIFARSWEIGESSPAGGLPWLWLVKGLLPLGFGLLVVATVSSLIAALVRVAGARTTSRETSDG